MPLSTAAYRTQSYLPPLIILCLYGVFTLLRLYANGNDISAFISAGDFFVDSEKTPGSILVTKNSVGYDGEFYYRLALAPFTQTQDDFGVHLDNGAFRQQRIGYPFLVWLFSCGDKAAAPILMVLVNLIGLCGIAYFGALIAKRYERSPLWGCLFALYPGFMMSYGRNLAEIVTAFWLLGGIYAFQYRRYVSAAFLFTLAMFCRESSLLVPAGAGIALLYDYIKNDRDLDSHPWHWMLLPLIAYLAWGLFLASRWHQPPITGGTQDINVPLLGIIKFLKANLSVETLLSKLNIFFFMFCCATLGIFITLLSNSRIGKNIKISLALYTLLLFSLSDVIWLSFGEFMRAYTETFILGMCIIVGYRSANRKIGALLTGYVSVSWIIMSLYFFH